MPRGRCGPMRSSRSTRPAPATRAASLSIMDITAALFLNEMNLEPKSPEWECRDRVIFSGGHKAPALYVGMAKAGYFPMEETVTLRKCGSPFQGHPHCLKLDGHRGLDRLARPGARRRRRDGAGVQAGRVPRARLRDDGRRRAAGRQRLGSRDERRATSSSTTSAPSSTRTACRSTAGSRTS